MLENSLMELYTKFLLLSWEYLAEQGWTMGCAGGGGVRICRILLYQKISSRCDWVFWFFLIQPHIGIHKIINEWWEVELLWNSRTRVCCGVLTLMFYVKNQTIIIHMQRKENNFPPSKPPRITPGNFSSLTHDLSKHSKVGLVCFLGSCLLKIKYYISITVYQQVVCTGSFRNLIIVIIFYWYISAL